MYSYHGIMEMTLNIKNHHLMIKTAIYSCEINFIIFNIHMGYSLSKAECKRILSSALFNIP